MVLQAEQHDSGRCLTCKMDIDDEFLAFAGLESNSPSESEFSPLPSSIMAAMEVQHESEMTPLDNAMVNAIVNTFYDDDVNGKPTDDVTLADAEMIMALLDGSNINDDGFDVTIFTDIGQDESEEDEIVLLRASAQVPEVETEVEVTSQEMLEENEEERTFVELRSMAVENVSRSDSDPGYDSSEASDMDLSHGSIDYSRTGPHARYQSTSISSRSEILPKPASVISGSRGHVQNGVAPDKSVFPSPEIPIARDANGNPLQGECLDLSSTGPYSVNATSQQRSYMHHSGGMSIELARPQNGVVQNGYIQGPDGATYYQVPRIKLESGIGIDPMLAFKPPMDYNHNHSENIPATPNGTFEAAYTPQNGGHLVNGCDVDGSRDQSMVCSVVPMEEETSSRIPLTVTSPEDDDDNDSGTESIGSKDSESSLRLSVEEKTPDKKDNPDKKRPGRKKGQVSKVYHLWEFIRDVLNDPKYCGTVIKWENEPEGIFRVVQSEVAASMWGAKKNNRTKMTYEKMSRSIRYSRKEGYFDDIPKDKGYPKKLCFKFGKKAHGWDVRRQTSVDCR